MNTVYSVLQINNFIKKMFEAEYLLSNVQVQGEVSNCKYHSSGHIYFTLKDAAASIKCVMFAGSRAGLTFSMSDGDCVIVTGSISVYDKGGTYQLYAKNIKKNGAGELYEKYLALKEKLEDMGMFAQEYKRPIPKHVKRLGVVTSPTGAAIRDIQNIASRRDPGIQIILYPALVQGDGAAESIVNGIKALENIGIDAMIVGRGGGSIEDLWAFNEEPVARAIFDSKVPIISAVGHETDFTIADFVADLRAPTPSAAAELAVTDVYDTIELINSSAARLDELMLRKLDIAARMVASRGDRLKLYNPVKKLEINATKLEGYERRLSSAFESAFSSKIFDLKVLAGRLDGSSPLKKLQSGYSFVARQGQNVTSINQVRVNDIVDIFVTDGTISAAVVGTNTANGR